jgi:hypothetical protein
MLRALGVAVVLTVGGCQDPYGTVGAKPNAGADAAKPSDGPTPAQPEAEPRPPDAAPEAKRIEKAKAGVTLLAAGAEPREVLTLAPEGKEQRRIAIEMTLGIHAGGKEVAPTVMPEMHAMLVAEAGRDAGAITYQFSIGGASRKDVEGHAPTERVAAAVDDAVAGLKETNGTIAMSDRGEITKFDLEAAGLAAPGLRPSLTAFQQLFLQLYPVIPAEAVGVGAKWKAVSHAELGGVAVQHEATYTLVSRKGDAVELDVAFTQAATLEADNDAEHGSVGTARIALDRRHVTPIKAAASSHTLRNFQVKAGERPSAVKMDQALELSISAE